MTHWNHDITTAPRDGRTVILATTAGHVGEAVPPDPEDEDDDWYWCGAACRIHPNHRPVAWMDLPEHPDHADRLDAAATEAINNLGLVAD